MSDVKPTSGDIDLHEGGALKARRLGIDTSQEAIIYMRQDCPVCRSEGFTAHRRVEVRNDGRRIVATLNVVTSEILNPGEAGLSDAAWAALNVTEGDRISVHHPAPVASLAHVRSKIYGNRLDLQAFDEILDDVVAGRYSDIQLSAFVSGCAGASLDLGEMIALTQAMVDVGDRLDWGEGPIVDKHCVGGLPGNRTTPIVVAIVAARGLTIPKTSSRAITSPAGTADTMEMLAPVELDEAAMRRVVESEGGCVVWGGAVRLSPADEILIRIERGLDIDSEGQLVASVLSKKIAAGSTHVVLDLPVGPSAKVRSSDAARELSDDLTRVAHNFNLLAHTVETDGRQPVGRGIGPALEARDVLAVLQGRPDAPADLAERAIRLAGEIFEMVGMAAVGEGATLAQETVKDGLAWKKFQAICEAQGGMRTPPVAEYTQAVLAARVGHVTEFDNRRLAKVAKLAGAPTAGAAGLDLHVALGGKVEKGEPLYTIHAQSPGELEYACDFAAANPGIIRVDPS